MKVAARLYRAKVLAAVFGGYFTFIMTAAWLFASRLSGPWFDPDFSRWIYTVYLIASAIFLTGLTLFAFVVEDSFERRIREVNRELGSLLLDDGTDPAESEELVLPSPEGPVRNVTSSLKFDVLLETLGEVQNQDVLLVPPRLADKEALAAHRLQIALLNRREELTRQQRLLAKLIPGPLAVAVGIFGVSIVMLPGAGGMLQSLYQLNTTLILGFAYAWIGLAAYFGVSVLGVIASFRKERKRQEA